MHGSSSDRRALEREALRNVINQWNANRLDLFELSEPNEDLEFHGVMRFYFQDSGQKVATKCIRVASDATVEDVIGTLVEKFRPDMRMLSVPSYALYELHENCPERKMSPDEKPLLVQLNWHVDDREGRFLLKNVDDKTVNSVGLSDTNVSFRRKLSKREKKQLKKQEKLSRLKSENGDAHDKHDGVAEKLYTELPETSFTRSISNPEAVMRRRRQQKLEKKLQQFRSKDGGPDTGGTLKIYGEALCRDVPYKTLLLSVRDCAGAVVREMLDKYGLNKADPSQWCLVQVTQQPGGPDLEYVLDDDECPLSILMNAPNTSSIMFHVRRRPADCAPRKRKKKPGALGTNAGNARDPRGEAVPLLVELGPDGSAPHPGDTARTIRLANDVMEVGSANGIALQLYGPHIQPRHCVITNTDGVTSLTPCHADAHTYVNGQRIHQTTILTHGSLIKFGHSNTYRFLDLSQEDRTRHPSMMDNTRVYDRSPRALSPIEPSRENFETTFDLEGNVETVSTASGAREDNRSLGSSSENRLSGLDRYPRGQDPILPAVLEFPEEPQEQFLARVITHLDVKTPTFRLAPAYTLYLCARYRASTHYRPELTPTERAHKLTLLLQHAAMLIRHTVQDRSTESGAQAFWLANASELLHFLKSDRHVSAFSLQAQDTLADAVQLAFRNLVACLTDELNSVMSNLMSDTTDDHPREVVNVLSNAMKLLRNCRVNAALTIQLFSQLFHWISARSLSTIINNPNLCTRSFGVKLFNRLRNLQAWAESQGLELAAECHLAKIVQCAHLLQAPKYTAEELANLSAACFKLNSLQLRALLTQYKGEPGEQVASPPLLEQAARAAEGVADELARAEGREVRLHEDPAPPLQLLLPDDGFSCDVVQGVPPGLADFLHPLQASGLCRLAAQPTSSGHWTVYMSAPRPPSAMSTSQPEVQVIRLHKSGGGIGLSIVAAKGAGQERLGIYIKSVVPGGAADRDGRLAAGDQLLSVDGQSLLGITQEKAAEFLVRTGSVVTLEVAKGGAVYHGLATLLQQPSPTPHRAMDSPFNYGSVESLYGVRRIFTPPAPKPKNSVFFSSDDSLYKSELKRLTVPRIEIQPSEPVFMLQVTDFSEPDPKVVTYECDDGFYSTNVQLPEFQGTLKDAKSWKEKTNSFVQQKNYSVDIPDIPFIDNEESSEKFLNIDKKCKTKISNSLQDLSSSTSSINSGVHESNLDLSHIDNDTPNKYKNWKSPDDIRQGGGHPTNFEDAKDMHGTASVPNLNRNRCSINRNKSISEENLEDKLTQYERMEILKLLYDWSLQGSDSKTSCDFDLKSLKKKKNDDDYCRFIKSNLKNVKYNSEPNLSPKNKIYMTKYKSENFLDRNIEFSHKCQFRNCIFNVDFNPLLDEGTNNSSNKENEFIPKSILKNSKETEMTQQRNVNFLTKSQRRFSEIIETKPFDGSLVRCDSLERLTQLQKKPGAHKKFPESYIVTRSTQKKTPKVVVLRKKCLPKNWKSCSDIKYKQKIVRKCCRNAKKSCPVLKSSEDVGRKVQSCAELDVVASNATCNRPRRMSERDLPSRVDQERTIPSSKSVPALHHISPNSEQPRTGPHDVFNPGYSRTSSNNSINTNSTPIGPQNGNATNQGGLRSRSTHNLHQQDAGFYQNLSIYRNKMPSPQQLGDRTSALRSSQNSLQSSITSSQRPSSAYYPPPVAQNTQRPNLHQSIPNLKNLPSQQRILNEEPRAGSIPSINHQYQQNYNQMAPNPNANNYPPHNSNYHGQNQQFMGQNPNYPRVHEELNNKHQYNTQYGGQKVNDGNPYPSPTHSYMGNVQQPLHVHANGQRQPDEMNRHDVRYNAGLLREDVFRHSQQGRHEEMMRMSKSEDLLRQHLGNQQNDMMRYASSGNIRTQESNKIELPQLRQLNDERNQMYKEDARINSQIRGQAKMAEMGEEVRRRQNRVLSPPYQPQQYSNSQGYYQHYNQQAQPAYTNTSTHMQMVHNTQSMQNLSISSQQNYPQGYYQNNQTNSPMSPTYPKSPPVAPKPVRKLDEPPELPPTSTHPLYSASSQDPPKMAFYPNNNPLPSKTPRDPWAREEQERQAEVRREQARQWQEQQIRELLALPHRTPQQEEQLRVLQLEREFQRRAQEAAEQDDDDTEKESPTPYIQQEVANPVAPTTPTSTHALAKVEPPASILKPGVSTANVQPPPEPVAPPPPPERGSSYTIMSLRTKETTKRVSFNDSSASPAPAPPNTLQIEETVREDPNSFIRQAESMLASPTTPTDSGGGAATATPGVIGAQEVYRDPRARRLAEQAQQKLQTTVPEKLSFKEKMKMFAMETGEAGTPKDKSKISRAQREIDNLASPNPSLVH